MAGPVSAPRAVAGGVRHRHAEGLFAGGARLPTIQDEPAAAASGADHDAGQHHPAALRENGEHLDCVRPDPHPALPTDAPSMSTPASVSAPASAPATAETPAPEEDVMPLP